MALKCHNCAIFVILMLSVYYCFYVDCSNVSKKKPTILVAIFIRNKEHTLPSFLSQFEQLNYPKQRMSLFLRSDHNIDRSIVILKKWLHVNADFYHSVNAVLDEKGPKKYADEEIETDWTNDRFDHIIDLKEEALKLGRSMWADYIWFLDADVIITNLELIGIMIDKNKPLVAPMLHSLGTYSNYWCGMSEDYWYVRTDDYLPILEGKNKGCFSVPMIHSSVFLDMNIKTSDKLSFDSKNVAGYTGPVDDIITFAISSQVNNLDMTVCNDEIYGFLPPPLNDKEPVSRDYLQMSYLNLEILVHYPPLKIAPSLKKFATPFPKKTKLGFDQVYLINLKRRPERRTRMYDSFDELGLNVKFFEAVDGSKLNFSYLSDIGVKQLDIYEDPYSKRVMTFGEIGCFLSHYYIWKDVVENQYQYILLFEDDIRFEPYFKEKVIYMMKEIEHVQLDWDLIYLGRKRLKYTDEPYVDGIDTLVHVDYSYWTLCYMLSLRGAKKLLAGKPLEKMVPVDEYLPIMFDKHPEESWSKYFSPRNLKAFSAAPMLVYPTHYTGEDGYISDTEDSSVIINQKSDSKADTIAFMKNQIGVGIMKDEL